MIHVIHVITFIGSKWDTMEWKMSVCVYLYGVIENRSYTGINFNFFSQCLSVF